ncbi:MAG TPA: peptidoglycan-binding protein [Pseudonocardiaceae bacterium]|nr:peptidoglycan-binding protein [Pseudonocardiaceae bacterium]
MSDTDPLTATITSATLNDAAVEQWFDAICAAYDDTGADADLATFTANLAERVPDLADAVEQFSRHLSDNGLGVADVARLTAIRAELPQRYRAAVAAVPAATPSATATPTANPAGPPAYDQHAWSAYLAENGPRWDGTDQNWQTFRTWFAYDAATRGLADPANGFLALAESQSVAERISTFARYGVTIRVPGQPAYDQNAWYAYLAENGPRWDGTDQNWQTFRTWFAYDAATRGLADPANGFLALAESQPVARRIDVFAQYGVVIKAPQAVPAPTPSTDTAAPQAARPALDDIDDTLDAETEQEILDELSRDTTEDGRPLLDDTDLDDDLLARVTNLQARLGLTPDGVVGPKTWETLTEFVGEQR